MSGWRRRRPCGEQRNFGSDWLQIDAPPKWSAPYGRCWYPLPRIVIEPLRSANRDPYTLAQAVNGLLADEGLLIDGSGYATLSAIDVDRMATYGKAVMEGKLRSVAHWLGIHLQEAILPRRQDPECLEDPGIKQLYKLVYSHFRRSKLKWTELCELLQSMRLGGKVGEYLLRRPDHLEVAIRDLIGDGTPALHDGTAGLPLPNVEQRIAATQDALERLQDLTPRQLVTLSDRLDPVEKMLRCGFEAGDIDLHDDGDNLWHEETTPDGIAKREVVAMLHRSRNGAAYRGLRGVWYSMSKSDRRRLMKNYHEATLRLCEDTRLRACRGAVHLGRRASDAMVEDHHYLYSEFALSLRARGADAA